MDRSRFPVDPWRLVETDYDPEDLGLTETLFSVANGYLGLRGNVEEGRDTFAHGTYVNGFHETWPIRHAEEAYGLARVGQTIVNVPDPKTLKLYVDDEPLLLSTADLEHYERSLDFRDGMLRREVVWRTSAGKRVRISSTRMVSVVQRHLAVMTFEVEMLDGEAPLVISSQVLNRQDGSDEYHVPSAAMGTGVDPRKAEGLGHRVLDPQLHELRDDRLLMGYRCHNSRMTLALAVQHLMETDNTFTQRATVGQDQGKEVYRIDARQHVPIRLTKIVSVHTSRGVPVPELADRCMRTLDRAELEGMDALHAEHAATWDRFWEESDVLVQGHRLGHVQQAVRWNLFQLGQASIRSGSHGIPAKGLTGSGYGGHYFWDTECYVLPFLIHTHPQAARNALRFRHGMLDQARTRASELSQYGALYPWRTINGEEASAYFAAGTAQYHINADVAYALMKYARATGDRKFLRNDGVDILVETARLWADLGFWQPNGDESFHIHAVTGPDEYTTVVNDNLFTNVMAQLNLRAAVEAVRELEMADANGLARAVARLRLGKSEVDDWERAADGMHIPYDDRLGVHPQDSHFLEREVWDLDATPDERRPLLLHYHPLVIYRFQVLKQADVVLALYLAGDQFSAEQKLADFDYYDPITSGDSSLSSVVQSIVAAEVGYQDLALRYFYGALFVDLTDRHGNTADGVHVASTGGVWSALVGGFGGMRDHGGNLTFDPRLPREWDCLTWRMRWHGCRLRVRLEHDALSIAVEVGGPVTVHVRGEQVQVGTEEVRVPLADQGPRRDGGPDTGDRGQSIPTDREQSRRVSSSPVPPGVVPHNWPVGSADITGPVPVQRHPRDV
ncbi:glycoside hydrolase family 65 protein [Ornithinimicrobium pratense]|uniref:Glycoside hydrolase family 65 protein n=1 Tax=Ornithinimicrobium pratense TaxID=2593973 RepID=A0A5J6V4R0_9MICO|nr:glycosyl hydrolase family 65 protein [Ornithinimicrobium pratense]QFG68062.1 glycoside hydrolase family 65 protein [Ornithinimicrobium pratense]